MLRDLARALRNEEGAFDSHALGAAFGATALGTGWLTFHLTGGVGWALGAAALTLPLQLAGIAWKRSAPVVAAVGSLLVAGAVTVLVAGVAGLFLPFVLGWLKWGVAVAAGVGSAFYLRGRFRQAIRQLGARAGWY